MSRREEIIVGLDVGSSAIRTVIAQRSNRKDSKPIILGVGTALSSGIRRGIVVDVEETVRSIATSVELAEKAAGVPVERAYVSIGGNHIASQVSKGVVVVSRVDGEISEEDVSRVIEAAQAVSLPNNREMIHIIPCTFNIDDQDKIKDPVGMNGTRLEVEALIIEGASPFIKNLSKCVHQAGIDIDEFVFSPLASAKSVLSKKQKELGVVMVDIGSGTTEMSIFEDNSILSAAALPIGAGHITNDIAIGLRVSVETAEKIKLEYGTALPEEVNKKDKINLSEISDEEEFVSRRYVAEIIKARLVEIFSMVDKKLKEVDRSGMLPAGVVLTGGGAKLPGIIDVAKETLRLPVQIGFPTELSGIVDKVDDPSFATAIGLIMWETDEENFFSNSKNHGLLNKFGLREVEGKIKKVFKTFLP